MVNNKVINSLKTLNAEEFKRFGLFLESPFFNTNPSIVKLYNILRNYYPAFESRNLRKEKVFKILYPGSSYKDGTIRNLLSDLAFLLQRFLMQSDFEMDSNEKYIRLLRQLDERRINGWFTGIIKKFETSVRKVSNIGYSYFDLVRQLEERKINYALMRGQQKSICSNVLKRSEYFIYNYVIHLLNQIHDLKINEDSYNAKYKFNLAKELADKIDFKRVLEVIEATEPDLAEIFKLFLYEGLAFLKIDDDKYYYEFKKMFFDKLDILNTNTVDSLFTSIENICIEKIYNGNMKFVEEQFNVFNERLMKKAYKDETNDFNIYLLRNIVLTAISNDKIDWLENFIKNYSIEIAPEFREDMENFVSALISFEKDAYSDSLNYISRTEDKAEIFKYTFYSLKLKIFYEINDFDSAEYLLDSFNHFVNQNKIVSVRFKNSNKEFIKAYQMLLKIKLQESSIDEILQLKEFIISQKYFKEKTWFLRKIKETTYQKRS